MNDLAKRVRYLLVMSIAVLSLISCKSGKMVVQSGDGVRLTVFDSFSSRLRMTLPLKKKGGYTLNGTLKIQRDQLIQLSLLAPLIRTEAARIEISPENVLVIDRMNKQYVSVPISELREVFHTEVDFQMLQSLLIGNPVETYAVSHNLQWKYNKFVSVGDMIFPSEITIFVGEKKKSKRTKMELTRLSVDKHTLTPTTVSSRYERVELDDVIKMLENL